MKNKWIVKQIVCLVGVGNVGKFPGTLASLVTCLFLFFLSTLFPHLSTELVVGVFILSTLLCALLGDWAARVIYDEKDPKQIVIDEVAGMSLTLIVVPFSLTWGGVLLYIFAFCSFRFFDIFKPFPVSFFDKRDRPFFLLLDDLTAGLMGLPFVILFGRFLIWMGL